MNVRLEQNAWHEAKALIESAKGVAVIPVGSIEQHGAHLPLGTDSYVAIDLATEACEQAGAVLVPPVWFGWSPHHMVLPGTITIRPNVLVDFVYDIMKSLKQHGINKFVLLNGHRIVNVVWMQICTEQAQRELGVTVKIFDPAYMSKDLVDSLGFGPLGHAEEIETSHMMHNHPDLVHIELAQDNPIIETPLYSVDPRYAHDTLCYVPSSYEQAKKHAESHGGTNGSPTKSDAAKGKVYHEHLVKNLVSVIRTLQEQ